MISFLSFSSLCFFLSFFISAPMLVCGIIGERERANLVLQLGRGVVIYIYIYRTSSARARSLRREHSVKPAIT